MSDRLMSCVLVLLLAFLTSIFLMQPSLGADEEGEGRSLRLVVVVAFIWIAIFILVALVVIFTRRRPGEDDRESREG